MECAESVLGSDSDQCYAYTRGMGNNDRAFTLPQGVGLVCRGDLRFAAVKCRCVQCFGFHSAAYDIPKLEFYLKLRYFVLVQDNH